MSSDEGINIELADVISKGFSLPPGCTWNVNGNEKKEGKVVVMNEEGLIYAELQYKNDELNGDCIFYEEGEIKEKIMYVNDVAEGWSYTYEDGKVVKGYLYEKGEKTKIIKQIEDSDFYVEVDRDNPDDFVVFTVDEHLIKNGFGYVYKNSSLESEIEYKDGKVVKTWKEFSDDSMKEYDGDHNLIYEGEYVRKFAYRCPRNGSGKEYKDGKVIFEGEWNWNKPNGKGCLRDENGKVIHEGEWCNGLIVVGDDLVYDYETRETKTMKFIVRSYEDFESLSKQIPKLVIKSDCCNERNMKSLTLCNFPNLRSIEIGNKSCKKVSDFTVCDLDFLESITIGDDCFTTLGGVMNVSDCPSLKELSIGGSFGFYDGYEMESKNDFYLIE